MITLLAHHHPTGEPVDGAVVLVAILLFAYVFLRSDRHK
jgi:hypothetical protein